ncbi:MAG TPA: MFS transporter [Methanocorpusculum sp.]|nr:MFS transporter [Methanocorpusculum sp.]
MKPEFKRIFALAAGHGAVDFYMPIASALLPSLIPLFQDQGITSYAAAGLLFTILAVMELIFQPVFGAMIDRNRWTPGLTLCCIVTAASVAGFAFTQNYWILLVCAIINGIMNSAYHPNAYGQIHQFTTEKNRGLFMSIMSVGGTFGYGAAPLVAGFLYAAGGFPALLFLLIPGIVVAVILLTQPQHQKPVCRLDTSAPEKKPNKRAAAILLTVSSIRSWVYYGFIAFAVVYLTSHAEVDYVLATGVVSSMIFAGMFGTLIAGPLSDRIGRKEVMICAYLLAGIAYLGIFFLSGIGAVVCLVISGFFMMATASVEIAAVQEVMPGSVGFASGIVIGIPQGVTAVSTVAIGFIADAIGLPLALSIQACLMVVAVILAIVLPYPLKSFRHFSHSH